MSRDVSVHLRQLNKPADGHPHTGHPVLCAAPSEQLETPAGGERGTMISAIQIYGRLVAWLLHPEGHNRSIEIWDWQTGRALWVSIFISILLMIPPLIGSWHSAVSSITRYHSRCWMHRGSSSPRLSQTCSSSTTSLHHPSWTIRSPRAGVSSSR